MLSNDFGILQKTENYNIYLCYYDYLLNYIGVITMALERIHNPKTHADYRIRQRTTNQGIKGQIMGRYKKRK